MQTNITIRYSGPSLDNGRMDVYEASANMIAFSEFMVAAVKTTYGESAEAKAEVSGFAHGSFITNLLFSVAGQAATVFTTLSPDQLWEVVKGAFDLWKHLKGEPPAAVVNNGLTCTVTNNAGNIINVRTDSLSLVFNEKAAEPIAKFVKAALNKDGYERLEINAESGEQIASVDRVEAGFFDSVGKQVTLSDNTARMVVQIVAAVFQDGNKWRLSDGEKSFTAAILDGDFLMSVNQGERFGKGDVLDVDMRIVQNGFGMKTSVDRSILKVHRHLTPQEQQSMF
jgi:hypothetical protein